MDSIGPYTAVDIAKSVKGVYDALQRELPRDKAWEMTLKLFKGGLS